MPNIVMFDNPAYVDSGGGFEAEADNTWASLTSFGYVITTFSGTTASSVAAALTNQNVIVIPEMSVNTWLPTADVVSLLQAFAAGGGTLVIHGYTGNQAQFLNSVFGFAVSEAQASGPFAKSAAATGAFVTAAAALPYNDATEGLTIASLPVGSAVFYGNGSQAVLAELPYGSGSILFVGWDWYNAQPAGTSDGGWIAAYQAALVELTGAGVAIAPRFTPGNDGSEASPVNLDAVPLGALDGAPQYNALAGDDWVILPDADRGWSHPGTFSAGEGNDVIQGGDRDDAISGGAGDDWLFGGAGHDRLTGAAGRDLLAGGAGSDVLAGGAGRDIFIFTASEIGSTRATGNHDVINDFKAVDDKIDISALYAGGTFGGLVGGALSGTAASAYKVGFTSVAGKTWISGDTTGDGIVDFTIELTGTHRLKLANFIVGSGADWAGAVAPLGLDYAKFHDDYFFS